jgi:hypothetical protein
MLDHGDRGASVVPEQRVEMRDVHDRDVAPAGHRMRRVGHLSLGGVVLEIDGGHIRARVAAEPVGGELDLVRPLEHDQIDGFVTQRRCRDLDSGLGPGPRRCPAQAVRVTVRREPASVVSNDRHKRFCPPDRAPNT